MPPRWSACIAPLGPHKTSSSAGGSLTMVRRKSQLPATSCGDFASFAPAVTSSSAREAVRFQTVSEYPAFKRFIPTGLTMSPRPIKPIAGFKSSLLNGGRHETNAYSAQNKETIVAEFRPGYRHMPIRGSLKRSSGDGGGAGDQGLHQPQRQQRR